MGMGHPKEEHKEDHRSPRHHQDLRKAGVKGSGVIREYHARRVAPLMAHVLLMHCMVPVA
jgi:hypothetical protein